MCDRYQRVQRDPRVKGRRVQGKEAEKQEGKRVSGVDRANSRGQNFKETSERIHPSLLSRCHSTWSQIVNPSREKRKESRPKVRGYRNI